MQASYWLGGKFFSGSCAISRVGLEQHHKEEKHPSEQRVEALLAAHKVNAFESLLAHFASTSNRANFNYHEQSPVHLSSALSQRSIPSLQWLVLIQRSKPRAKALGRKEQRPRPKARALPASNRHRASTTKALTPMAILSLKALTSRSFRSRSLQRADGDVASSKRAIGTSVTLRRRL